MARRIQAPRRVGAARSARRPGALRTATLACGLLRPLPGEQASPYGQHDPGDRVLEEARVEQRVDEQREERDLEGEPERMLLAANLLEHARAAEQQPGVESETDRA